MHAATDRASQRLGDRVADGARETHVIQREIEAERGAVEPLHEPLGHALGALRTVLEGPRVQHGPTLPWPLD